MSHAKIFKMFYVAKYVHSYEKNYNFPLHDSNIKAHSHLSFVPSGGAKYVIFLVLKFSEILSTYS